MAAESTHSLQLFYCYAREDKALREELDTHLSALKRQNYITTWYDREIVPGKDWEKEIGTHLKSADIIVLLVSPNFMASDYCYSFEMQQALERHKNGTCRVIPIIIRSVDWEDAPFSYLQVLPSNTIAVTSWLNRDEAYSDVAKGIRMAVKDLHTQKLKEHWLMEGHAHLKAFRYQEALHAYEQAIRLDPSNAALYNSQGDAFYRLQHYQEALRAYEQAIRLDPNLIQAYIAKGDTLQCLNRKAKSLIVYAEALVLTDRIVQDSTTIEMYNLQGDALYGLELFQYALIAFNKAIQLDPNNAISYHNKGNTLERLRRYKEALAAFDKAIQLDPTDTSALNGKGNALSNLKRYEEALTAYDQAIQLDPNNAAYHGNIGTALERLRRYKEALTAFEQAIQLDPNNAIIYFNKGIALNSLKRHEEALTAFEQAIQLDPDFTRASESRNQVLVQIKKKQKTESASNREESQLGQTNKSNI